MQGRKRALLVRNASVTEYSYLVFLRRQHEEVRISSALGRERIANVAILRRRPSPRFLLGEPVVVAV